MRLSTAPRRAAAAAVALLGVLVWTGSANAVGLLQAQAQDTSTQSVTTARFAVVPTAQAASPTTGPLVLTYAAVLSPGPQYFDAVNTGSIDLVGASYAVALTSAVSLGSNSLTLTACIGASWANGTCSGSQVALGTWTSASSTAIATSTAPAAPSARLSIRASLSAGVLTAVTVATISVSVSSGPTRQIRAARTTSS